MLTGMTYILKCLLVLKDTNYFCPDLGRFQTTNETESMPNARESGGTL